MSDVRNPHVHALIARFEAINNPKHMKSLHVHKVLRRKASVTQTSRIAMIKSSRRTTQIDTRIPQHAQIGSEIMSLLHNSGNQQDRFTSSKSYSSIGFLGKKKDTKNYRFASDSFVYVKRFREALQKQHLKEIWLPKSDMVTKPSLGDRKMPSKHTYMQSSEETIMPNFYITGTTVVQGSVLKEEVYAQDHGSETVISPLPILLKFQEITGSIPTTRKVPKNSPESGLIQDFTSRSNERSFSKGYDTLNLRETSLSKQKPARQSVTRLPNLTQKNVDLLYTGKTIQSRAITPPKISIKALISKFGASGDKQPLPSITDRVRKVLKRDNAMNDVMRPILQPMHLDDRLEDLTILSHCPTIDAPGSAFVITTPGKRKRARKTSYSRRSTSESVTNSHQAGSYIKLPYLAGDGASSPVDICKKTSKRRKLTSVPLLAMLVKGSQLTCSSSSLNEMTRFKREQSAKYIFVGNGVPTVIHSPRPADKRLQQACMYFCESWT